jgi:hypothetical protein
MVILQLCRGRHVIFVEVNTVINGLCKGCPLVGILLSLILLCWFFLPFGNNQKLFKGSYTPFL